MKTYHPIWDDYEAFIPFRNEPYHIEIDVEYDEDGVPSKCNIIHFEPTNYIRKESNSGFVKWGGYPDFMQSEYVPMSDDGVPYDFLCCSDRHWGDSGTWNVFVLVREKDESGKWIIEDVYMEASCC